MGLKSSSFRPYKELYQFLLPAYSYKLCLLWGKKKSQRLSLVFLLPSWPESIPDIAAAVTWKGHCHLKQQRLYVN